MPTYDTSELLTAGQAARYCPGQVSPSTIYRWIDAGVKLKSGRRIRLEHHRVGKKILIPLSALENFFDRCSNPELFEDAEAEREEAEARLRPRPVTERKNGKRQTRSDKERRRAIRRAEQELEADGL